MKEALCSHRTPLPSGAASGGKEHNLPFTRSPKRPGGLMWTSWAATPQRTCESFALVLTTNAPDPPAPPALPGTRREGAGPQPDGPSASRAGAAPGGTCPPGMQSGDVGVGRRKMLGDTPGEPLPSCTRPWLCLLPQGMSPTEPVPAWPGTRAAGRARAASSMTGNRARSPQPPCPPAMLPCPRPEWGTSPVCAPLPPAPPCSTAWPCSFSGEAPPRSQLHVNKCTGLTASPGRAGLCPAGRGVLALLSRGAGPLGTCSGLTALGGGRGNGGSRWA